MLRRIRVQNFMSLRDTTVDLGPLTIFIGPNAAGKSAIFKALVTVSKLLRMPVRGPAGEFTFEPAVTFDDAVWRGNAGLPIVFQVWDSDDPDDAPGYTLQLRKEVRGWGVDRERIRLDNGWFDSGDQALEFPTERRGTQRLERPYRGTLCNLVYPYRNDQAARPIILPFLDFADRFGVAWRYRPSAPDIASFVQQTQQTEQPEREKHITVSENGWGLSWALQSLQGEKREVFLAIEEQLRGMFPHIKFINFHSERFGVRLAFTTVRSEDVLPAPMESDGVLLATFLLWRLHTAPPALKVCIEEPENGTHPYLLRDRYRLLRRFAVGELGRAPVQLLVATHSPDFLSAIEDYGQLLETIRVVEFDSRRGTTVHKLSSVSQIETLLKVFDNNLGELWWSGAIGAVPIGT